MEVAAKIKIMPKGIGTDFEKLKADILAVMPEGARLQGFAEEPIVFGLKALMAVVLVEDAEGGTEKVEEAFVKVHGVESVQVIDLGRI